MSKLIVLRGNSGSGKSTVALAIRSRVPRVTIIEQDYYQKYTIRPKEEKQESVRRQRIFDDVAVALRTSDVVILEGILKTGKYKPLIDALVDARTGETYHFYFDLEFDETVKRHATRAKAAEFGEDSMKEWYAAKDRLGHENETIITKDMTAEQVINLVRLTCEI